MGVLVVCECVRVDSEGQGEVCVVLLLSPAITLVSSDKGGVLDFHRKIRKFDLTLSNEEVATQNVTETW